MFRKKFIDRLRDKYQRGGYKNPLTEPYITLGSRTINTEAGNRAGFGGRISVPILESIRHGESSTGLRGEIDAYAATGNQNLRGDLEATTDIGTMPDDMATSPKVSNRSFGLRGYYNRNLGRRNNLSLKTNVGMGLGTGEKHGEYIYKDADEFGGYGRSGAEGNELASYADANVSLLRRLGQRQGIQGGLTASYGTKNAPNPGLRLGLTGSAGPLTAGVGYDLTNKAPRFNVGLKFQEGGWNKAASFGAKALKYIPAVSRSVGSKVLGPLGLLLGSTKAYAPPVTDPKTGVNRFTGETRYTPFGQTPSWGGGSGNVNVADVNKQLSAAMAPKINQTGGMYNERKKYHEGGADTVPAIDIDSYDPNATPHMELPHHAGGNTGGDTGMYDDPTASNSPTYMQNTMFGDLSTGTGIVDKSEIFPGVRTEGEWGNVRHYGLLDQVLPEGKFKDANRRVHAIGRKILNPMGGLMGKAAKGIKKFFGWRDGGVRHQTGGMYNQMQQYEGGGVRSFHLKGKDPLGRSLQTGGMYNPQSSVVPWQGSQMMKHGGRPEYEQFHDLPQEEYDQAVMEYQQGGMYDEMKQYQKGGEIKDNTMGDSRKTLRQIEEEARRRKMYLQTGGVALPGGEMQPIPGSDAVEFSGADHDEGGIMMDPQTEVEDGETMDQVTMAKRGGNRKDYFFSSHLKLGGRKFSDIHKDILQKGGTQEDIDWLAQMQEKKAGRNPNQVAQLGGVAKYQEGGEFDIPQYDPYWAANQPELTADNPEAIYGITTLEEQAKKDEAARLANLNVSGDPDPLTVSTPAEVEYAKLNAKVIEAEATGDKKGKKKWLKRLKNAMKDTPTGAYIAGAAQLLPAAHAWFSKQPDAEQIEFTPGFTSPIVAERGKASDLERVDYNQDIANIGSEIRGMNRFIETSGGGPANIINKMVAFGKGRRAKDKVRAAETRANIDISNREAQMEQQMTLDNLKRSQQAAITNAQLARAEAARADVVEGLNAAARQKLKDDKAAMKGKAVGAFAQGVAGILGDVLSYKSAERVARTIGSEGIYDRDEIYGELIKQGIEPEIAKKKATELYNARMELLNLKT